MTFGSAAIRLGVRAVLIGIATAVAAWLTLAEQLYATALVVAGVAVLLGFDLAAELRRVARWTPEVLSAALSGATDLPATGILPPDLGIEADKVRRAVAERHTRLEAELHLLQGLLDSVPAALFVVEPDGHIRFSNTAARRLGGDGVANLGNFPGLGRTATQALLAAPAGARRVMRLANAERVVAAIGAFSGAGGQNLRLIALQPATGVLDALEVNAWRHLTSVLAHEMMNSLTPIASLSESLQRMLEDGPEAALSSKDLSEAIEAIARRSRSLMDFVNRYRAVEQLPAPRTTTVELAGCLRRMDQVMSGLMDAAGVVRSSEIEPPDLALTADPELLEQALINLVHNALDAVTGVDRPEVRVRAFPCGSGVAIEVVDNGRGFGAEAAEDIFVPFYTSKKGGSGIGLTIARQIAIAHGGTLQARSEPGAGAVFRLELPAVPPT